MEINNLKKALEDLVSEYKKKLEAQAKIDKTHATGEFSKSFKSEVTKDGFEISSTAKHASDVDGGAEKHQTSRNPNIGNILRWAKIKRLRPYRRLPWGTTRFVKVTEKSMFRMASIISKGIKKKGTIKRYNYEGSKIFEKVFASMQKKTGVEIGSAFSADLREELITIVNKFNK